MTSRRQKVEMLLADFQLLRRAMVFRTKGSQRVPQVTPSQWGALMFVEQCGSSTVKDVAKALGITSSAATQLVEGLVTTGYLVRTTSEEDRRVIVLTLSKKSRSRVAQMKKQSLERFLKVFEALSDTEFDHYLALNKKIVQKTITRKLS